MKEGWEYKKLGEVCRIERGGSPRPIKDFITNSPDGLNWIKIGDTDPQGKYIYSTKEKIKPEGLRKSRWVEVDEFLLSNSMSFGRPYILKTNGCIHDGWLVLRDYQKSLIIDYFYYLLISPHVQNQFRTKAQGSTVSNLNTDRVADVNIAFPSLSEQQSIVDYLDSAFAKIDAMKANAEKALNEAKALFQASLKEMLEPKDGWEEKTLKEIAQIKIGPFGSLLHKKDYITGGVPLVNPIHMVNGHIAIDNNYTIWESKAKELSLYRLKENDIVFARRGEIGRCALVGEKEDTYLCGTGSLFVRFNQVVDYGFMLLLFQSKYCKEYLEKQATGATMLNINSAIVGDMSIKYPHINIQHSIVATLDSLKSKVDRLQENYDKISQECDALKQALLKEVFEG